MFCVVHFVQPAYPLYFTFRVKIMVSFMHGKSYDSHSTATTTHLVYS